MRRALRQAGRLVLSLSLGVAGLAASGCGGSSNASSTLPTAEVDNPETLYKRLGGVDVLRLLVDEWLLEVSSDARIRALFANVDIAHLKLRLVERICVQVEGPCLYRGRDMYEAHADLELEDSQVRAFLQALNPAMQRANIAEGPAEELRGVIRGLAEELAIAVVR